MNTSLFNRSIVGIFFALVCSMTIYAVSPKNYLHDTKEEDGKIVSKTIFLEQNGLLNQQVKYEFTYNGEGKVAEKKAYRWNKNKENWEPFYLITYAYGTENGDIRSVYKMWNNKTNDYSLNIQEMILPASAYEDIFS